MLIFDQLRKNDSQLRVITWGVLSGIAILLAGLWHVQVFSYRHYADNQKAQAFRTVRIPGIRGKILDRYGYPLVENQPSYNLTIYIDELRPLFKEAWKQAKPRRKTTRIERVALEAESRYSVFSNIVDRLSQTVQQPIPVTREQFLKHYTNQLALPMILLRSMTPIQVARFQEQANTPPGVDLEIQPQRNYPNANLAAHILGFLKKDDSSAEGEDSFFNFRMPDYRGVVGIEGVYDQELRGKAGIKSVLVNSLGYRQSETIWNPAEPGKNVVLTIDLGIQKAAEKALQSAPAPYPGPVRGAVVVLDPRNGDILAMASSPTFDPNSYVRGMTHEEYAKLTNAVLRPQLNRATQENYAPGSIFKIVVGLASLDAGLDPLQKIYCPKVIWVGRRPIKDPQAPVDGEYDFTEAFMKSSNSYFITNGLTYGPDGIIRLGRQLHLGEKTGFEGPEVKGFFPEVRRLLQGWGDGDTANISIGQGDIAVTPLQMAIMTAAVANGGNVLAPRVVERIVPQDPLSVEGPTFMPSAKTRGSLHVTSRSLDLVRHAMLADVEDPGGTGKASFIAGFRVCGKTGTAQKTDLRNELIEHITWFASYAPFENPRYVVLVMVEGGKSGGGTCAPVAGKIYKAIYELESSGRIKVPLIAER